ncbi:predicted protein [Clavispora lusitaniae ATCC 42720]|uniref:Uncharacterized protein n=1 Tax=Clavispora lusitaniae (strain ATCC 42720) TaxID=306902 RepID=C4Y1E9_CLAL4|nr:uncharacterized protein CLUG_02031 [Clavispora lusitaniae ATCC 42720]EEQ37908.1 predicted protein [Clavispora lusitaniae ATCC 42720]
MCFSTAPATRISWAPGARRGCSSPSCKWWPARRAPRSCSGPRSAPSTRRGSLCRCSSRRWSLRTRALRNGRGSCRSGARPPTATPSAFSAASTRALYVFLAPTSTRTTRGFGRAKLVWPSSVRPSSVCARPCARSTWCGYWAEWTRKRMRQK